MDEHKSRMFENFSMASAYLTARCSAASSSHKANPNSKSGWRARASLRSADKSWSRLTLSAELVSSQATGRKFLCKSMTPTVNKGYCNGEHKVNKPDSVGQMLWSNSSMRCSDIYTDMFGHCKNYLIHSNLFCGSEGTPCACLCQTCCPSRSHVDDHIGQANPGAQES